MAQLISMAVAIGISSPIVAGEKEDIETIRSSVGSILRGAPDLIRPAQMPGLYVIESGSNILYSSADGRFLITGDLIDIKNRVNLTQARMDEKNGEVLAEISDDGLIIYPAKGEERYRVTVFTDVDCVYCRRLHAGMDEMNNQGITVRYLAYPRAGMGSASYDKIAGAWCAEDQRQALTDAKMNSKFTGLKCDNPIADHLAIGGRLGVDGTPAVFMDDGTKIGGYLTPAAMMATLNRVSSN